MLCTEILPLRRFKPTFIKAPLFRGGSGVDIDGAIPIFILEYQGVHLSAAISRAIGILGCQGCVMPGHSRSVKARPAS